MKQIKLTKANLEKLVANPPSQRDEYRTDIGGCYYWPSKVLSVNRGGAVIQSKVQVTYNCLVGGNNGWGEAVNKKDVYTFTCLSENVAKGSYPRPDVFLRDTGGKGFDVWAYNESRPTPYNDFVEDTSTRKGYEPVRRSTEDVFDDFWIKRYWGLDLAKKYYSEHMKSR